MNFFIITFIIVNCGNKSVHIEEDLTPTFNKAMKYFEKGKFSRARDEFDYIINLIKKTNAQHG